MQTPERRARPPPCRAQRLSRGSIEDDSRGGRAYPIGSRKPSDAPFWSVLALAGPRSPAALRDVENRDPVDQRVVDLELAGTGRCPGGTQGERLAGLKNPHPDEHRLNAGV